jgi:AcrR family transcriptional regulator
MPAKAAAAKKSNKYYAHRERQQRRILDAAWKLFDDRGIDRVTMAEIISVSGLQPSTMYQYFSNKDDIVWALLSDFIAEGTAHAKHRVEGPQTGLSRITSLLEFMADELSTNRARVRFMAQFDAMYARDWPAERLITLEAQINPEGFRYFRKLVREGIADGSLRSDLDPNLTMHAVINAVVGAQRRLASLGSKVELEYGQPIDRLFRETIRILLLGLRADNSPAKPRPTKSPKVSKHTVKRRLS